MLREIVVGIGLLFLGMIIRDVWDEFVPRLGPVFRRVFQRADAARRFRRTKNAGVRASRLARFLDEPPSAIGYFVSRVVLLIVMWRAGDAVIEAIGRTDDNTIRIVIAVSAAICWLLVIVFMVRDLLYSAFDLEGGTRRLQELNIASGSNVQPTPPSDDDDHSEMQAKKAKRK